MLGKVITEELNVNKLEAGSVCVLQDVGVLEIVTIQHINPKGNWVVTGADFDNHDVPAAAALCRIVVIDSRGVYPLKFNQWKNAIRNKEVNSGDDVEFELIPAKFKEGKYIATCNECTAQFLGAKRQPTCQECCKKDVTARIVVKKKVKPKKPGIKSDDEIKALALTSFQMGMKCDNATLDPEKRFMTWLEKQF
jgi:hypothetical protein